MEIGKKLWPLNGDVPLNSNNERYIIFLPKVQFIL